MEPLSEQIEASDVVEVSWSDRWQVYRRLQELTIPCWCVTNQPLKVYVANIAAAIQLRSVLKQHTANRQELICTLERCWQKQLDDR